MKKNFDFIKNDNDQYILDNSGEKLCYNDRVTFLDDNTEGEIIDFYEDEVRVAFDNDYKTQGTYGIEPSKLKKISWYF